MTSDAALAYTKQVQRHLVREYHLIPYFAMAGVAAFMSGLNRSTLLTINRYKRQRANPGRSSTWTIIDFLIMGGLIAFSAMRWNVGTDYVIYSLMFEKLQPTNWAAQIAASPQESGYTLMALFLRQFSDSPEPLFWVTSTLTVVPIYLALKKSSRDMTMSLVLYVLLAFYVAPFNIIRQGIAVSLSFWAHTFIDKNKTAFVVINAIASAFHITALFVAVIQFLLKNRRASGKSVTLILLVAVLLAASFTKIPGLIDFMSIFNERYENYIVGASAGLGTYLLVASRMALGFYGAKLGKSENYARYALYILVGVAFLIVGTQSVVVSRMETYFGIFLLLLVPNQLNENRNRIFHKTIIYIACAVYFGFYLVSWGELVPYQVAPLT